MSKPASLRPVLPQDMETLAELFAESIAELAQDDYDEGQRNAWAALADDSSAFAARLNGALTILAERDGEIAGFASLKDASLDMLYVHPEFARQGIATQLCDALEKLATARKIEKISTDASDTARPLFEARGYVAQRRNTVTIDDQWLGNTTMTKPLTPLN